MREALEQREKPYQLKDLIELDGAFLGLVVITIKSHYLLGLKVRNGWTRKVEKSQKLDLPK